MSTGWSVGVTVEPGDAKLAETNGRGIAIMGSTDQITEALERFKQVGVTQVETMRQWTRSSDGIRTPCG